MKNRARAVFQAVNAYAGPTHLRLEGLGLIPRVRALFGLAVSQSAHGCLHGRGRGTGRRHVVLILTQERPSQTKMGTRTRTFAARRAAWAEARLPCSETGNLNSGIRLRGSSSLASQPMSCLFMFVQREAGRRRMCQDGSLFTLPKAF